jgi:hypothetical protein
MPNDRLSRQQERNARGRMRYSSVSDELLPLLQVQKPDQHPDDAGGQKKDAAFYDDAFPDDRQEIVGEGEGVEEDIPEGTLDKRRVAEDQQGDADDNHQNGSPVAAAGDGGKHKGKVPEKKDREH